MESSNTPDTISDTTAPVESPAPETTPQVEAAPKEPATLKEAILSKQGKTAPEAPAPDAKAPVVPQTPPAPVYAPNYKYKAFGKEKEIPEFFRGLIKDQDGEKQVRDVFTRADAFDDMKGRYDFVNQQHQDVLKNFNALDRDVKRLTGFLTKGDYDNFFAGLRISDSDLFKYLQNKAQFMQDPSMKATYENQVQLRAQNITQQEQYEQMRTDYQSQAVQSRTMQLDMLLARPDIASVASAWDGKTGEIGSFRNLVIQEAAMQFHMAKQDLTAEQAVQMALTKFGKFVASQAPLQTALPPEIQAPQAHQTIPVAAKPVIPSVQGKGTSPVKQVPKSLDDLRRMRKDLERAENMSF